MNNRSKKVNFNHSFIFFLVCNIFSLMALKFNTLTISPFICLLLILSIGISHGSLDNLKGRKLFHILEINNFFIFYIAYILISLVVILILRSQYIVDMIPLNIGMMCGLNEKVILLFELFFSNSCLISQICW